MNNCYEAELQLERRDWGNRSFLRYMRTQSAVPGGMLTPDSIVRLAELADQPPLPTRPAFCGFVYADAHAVRVQVSAARARLGLPSGGSK